MNPTDAAIQKEARAALSFGASHLVLILALLTALVGAVYLFDSRRAEQADARASLAEYKAQEADKSNAALQQQVATQVQALAQQNAVLQAQVASLAQAVASRDAALATRTAQIPTLAPSELSTQWGSAAAEPAPAIDAQGHFLASLPLAQKSLIALSAVPLLEDDKKDLQAQVDEEKQQVENGAKALDLERQAHQSDNASCVADKNSLQAKIVKVKADAKRSRIKWFFGGVVAGVTLGIVK